MTLEELMGDADRSAREFAAANVTRRTGSGIPPPPQIVVDETVLEPQRMNLQFRTTPQEAQAFPAGGGGGPPPTLPGCNANATGTENLTFFDTVVLTLRVYGHTQTTCNMGGSGPWFWTFDETFTRTLTRQTRNLVTPVKPIGDHFQLWKDVDNFEHFELPDTIDCFNCFGGWTSCTAAMQVSGFMGERINLCPAGYAPENSGQTWFVAAQFTWFNSTGVAGWSAGNELQLYYYDTQFYACDSGSPDFFHCEGSGMNPGNTPFDSHGGKNLANLPGTYHHLKTLLNTTTGDPPVSVYLYYDFTVTVS